jgi:hypothetical protein
MIAISPFSGLFTLLKSNGSEIFPIMNNKWNGLWKASSIIAMMSLYVMMNRSHCVFAQEQNISQQTLGTNSPFVIYLQNPPWIKKLKYTRSMLWKEGNIPPKIDKEEWGTATYFGAVQPGGYCYFDQSLVSAPFTDPSKPSSKSIMGMSDDYYWAVTWDGDDPTDRRGLTLGSTHAQLGGSDDNAIDASVNVFKNQLQAIRYYGLPPLQTNSIKLLQNNLFVAVTADGEPLNISVLSSSNNRPYKLCYYAGSVSNQESLVTCLSYRYDGAQSLPNYFEVEKMVNGKPAPNFYPATNWIEQIEYGLDFSASNGYKPSMFFTNIGMFNFITMYSNGTRYLLFPSNKMVEYTPEASGEFFKSRHESHVKSSNAKFIFMLIIPLSAVGIWLITRRRVK